MANVNVTVRMDESLKKQADELFSDLGLTFSGAITIFVKQSLREQGIPFALTRDIPNKQALEAIKEVELVKADPFYSESNMAHLRRGIDALNTGKGVEHELIEDDEQ